MRVRVIANPIAGGGLGRQRAEELVDALARREIEADLRVTEKAGDAEAAAGDPAFDGFVSVGGDGTLSEVVNGLARPDQRVAVLALGTANVMARELHEPKTPDGIAALVASGQTRVIDTGRCRGRRFLQSAGGGLDAAVMHHVHAHRGRRQGLLTLVWPTLKVVLNYRYPKIRVIVDGETICEDGEYAVVGNCQYSAGVFRFTPESDLGDGTLDICVMRRLSVWKLIILAVASLFTGFSRRKDILYRTGSTFTLEPAGDEPVPFQVDGDPSGCLPATIEVEPRSLHVIAPTA